MIVYHKNDEIDRELWDNCIKNSHSHRPWAYSWYLDHLAPGWEALVDDDYDSVFPVPSYARFGIKFTATPVFLQQLGAFSPDKPADNAIVEFLDYMPDVFRLTDLGVGQKVEYPGYRVTEKSNYELSLSSPFEKLWDRYTPECRKYISTASKKGYVLSGNVSPEELLDIYKGNLGFSLRGVKMKDYECMLNLMRYCTVNGKGSIIGVRTPRKKLVYGIFVIKIPGSITIVLESNTARSVEKHIGFFVINEIIRDNSSTATKLDFAGTWYKSAIPAGQSFGGRNVPYYRIFRNRLLLPARLLK
jgi:hypothetical protein